MKDKIMIFIIGLLVGAVITALGFLVYEKVNKNTNKMKPQEMMQMMERRNGEMPPEKPDGMENDQGRPELPSDNNSSISNKES